MSRAINRIVLIVALTFILSFSPNILWAGEKTAATQKTIWGDIFSDIFGHYPLPSLPCGDGSTDKATKLDIPKNWEFNMETERYVGSYTSYEFGTIDTKPLSRLEFPVNTWWLNFDVRRTCPRWSIGARTGFSLNRNSNNWMLDSDWHNEGSEHVLDTYSKSYCDVREGLLFRGDVDVNISDWLRLPPSMEIRPLFAFQFQRFNLMAHDGVQWNYEPNTSQKLQGDSISFRQDWWLYLIGLRGSYNFNINKNMTVKLKGEADWGPALGYNEDHHILRGDRWTYENTLGNALYLLTGLDMTISKTITIGVGINYLWIRTSGAHRWWDPADNADYSWTDGVHVWSDQLGLTAHASYAF